MNALNIFSKTVEDIFMYKNSEQSSSQNKSKQLLRPACLQAASTVYNAGDVTVGNAGFSQNFPTKCFTE